MPSIIRVLDDKTINKIAAGEVIENSASCVKELIENAIDAKATLIEVHIIAGGRKKIEVIDNGCGMGPDDAYLSLERHATSKLKKIEDMNALVSMGFRGEALPSIASISKLTLKTSDGEKATEILVHGGKVLKQSVASRPKGTSVEVQSLFFNVPARKEFQKSVSHDVGEVTRVMTHMALVHPEIGFRFVSDQKEVFNLIGQAHLGFLETSRYRIQELFGEELASSLIEVNHELEGYQVRGFISQVETTRPNRLGQHFYVNGRSVQSKLISWAIQEGYSTRLPQKRFPVAFLFIQMDPNRVDVNVHPQKREVRFRDSFTLKKCLSQMINSALQSSVQDSAHYNEFQTIDEKPLSFEQKEENSFGEPFEVQEPLFSGPSVFDQVQKIKIVQREPAFSTCEEALEVVPHLIGIFGAYLFVEAKSCQAALNLPQHHLDGIVVVHQKRAKERLLFDHLVKKDHQVSVQNLLLAETLEYGPSDAQLIESALPYLNKLGVSIRSLGGSSFILDGLPAMLNTTDVRNIMEGLLEEMRLFGFHRELHLEKENLLAKAVAKTVHLEKKIEEPTAALALLKKWLKSEDPLVSPKGKPIIKVLDQHDLSKLFN